MDTKSRLQTVVELVMHREALVEKLERIQTMREVFASNKGRDGCRSIEFKSDYTAHVSISSTFDRELLQEILEFANNVMVNRLAGFDKVLAQAEEALGDIIEERN